MDKRIEDYLHLYLGCEVMYKDEIHFLCGLSKPYKTNDKTIPTFSVRPNNKGFRSTIYSLSNFEDLKLILRPLSDIADEHINELWQAVGYNTEYESPAYPGMTKRKFLKRVFGENENEQRIEITFENAVIFQNFLRKRGYDCDMLVPAGLAIDKTKL